MYLPNYFYKQDVTQGKILSWVQQILILSFSFRLITLSLLKN